MWKVAASILIIMIVSIFVGLFANTMFQLHESNAKLLHLSITDGLSGCLNRRAYEEALSDMSNKTIDENFVYVTADVNGLKQTNDTMGHLFGDELICGAALCMQDCFGDYGDIYRIGGDEFVALINADDNTLAELMKKIHTMADGWKGHGVEKLALSVGYVSVREFPDAAIDTLVKTADERMYKAKREYYENQGFDRRKGDRNT